MDSAIVINKHQKFILGNDRYVFNIKGNDYRLVAMIFLQAQAGQVYIRWIGTHAEYDKIKDIDNL